MADLTSSSSSISENNGSTYSSVSLLLSHFNSLVTVKLDASNYIIWKSQIQNLMRAAGLIGFLTGLTEIPPEEILDSQNKKVQNPDFRKWELVDAHIFSCVTATLTPSIYTSILDCTRSKEVWDLLAKRFTSMSRSHIHQLKNKLQNVSKQGLTMEAYLAQIKDLSDQLALVGSMILDEDLILQTLNGLPDEYNAFKTTIRARPSPITMSDLSALLCSEAVHVENVKKSTSSSEIPVAFAMNKGPHNQSHFHSGNSSNFNGGRNQSRGGYRGGRNQFQFRGGFRGGLNYNQSNNNSHGFTGHNSNNFSPQQQFQSGFSQPSSSLPPVVCQICGETYHTAVECWYRLDTSYQGTPPNVSTGGNARAYLSTTSASNSPPWYIDSAATNHMTNELENLQIHQPYQGHDQVLVGNGNTLPIQHTGTGFSFGEVGCIRTRNKVTSCHFSSDGKLLASAGHDKKAVLWNMDTLQTESTPEEHQHLITDVRFRPNSTQLATASFDKSVRLWDAANPSYCLHAYTGHPYHVISLDFHPKKNDLLCFCDSNNEVRYWNINPFTCTRVSKQGASAQVRFQPISGHLLAATSDKVVSIFDVETDREIHTFQGHSGIVNYLCWDPRGDYLACISEESVKVWSLASGECIHELSSNGNRFYSCVFHPRYVCLLVIGGLRSLELWNMAENKSMTVQAHENKIAALAVSPLSGMVASASHDSSVKLWK